MGRMVGADLDEIAGRLASEKFADESLLLLVGGIEPPRWTFD